MTVGLAKILFDRAGATGLNAAVESDIVTLSWRYLPVILASSLIMLGWAMIINNLGRRRYPLHWWAPGATFVRESNAGIDEDQLNAIEEARVDQEDRQEGALERENIESSAAIEKAEEPEGEDPELDAEPVGLEDLADLRSNSAQRSTTSRA